MTRNRQALKGLLLGTCIAALLAPVSPLTAQEQPTASTSTPAETAAAAEPGAEPGADTPDLLEPNEVDALVAPVVLYPDPLLTLVLQASISPLDVVEAERFLQRREKDATLTPDPDWDESVVGLLNYPDLVGSMSEYLDWTQLLGSAVADQLDAVQASIQILRLAAVDRGILVSNDVQKVVVTEGVVMIAPASKDTMSVPQYDPVALLAALTPAEEVPVAEGGGEATAAGSAEQPSAAPPAKPEPAPAAEAPPPAEPEPAPVAEAPPPAEAAPAESAPVAAPSPAPTYYAEPTYAAPPPPVSYGAPQSTFWSTAATFAGGAAVGGLLGYVWGDDDDDDDDDNDDGWDDVEDAIRDLDDDDWDDFVDNIDEDDFDDMVDRLDDRDWDEVRDRRRDVNISDSTIVVGNDVRRNQLDAKLKNKRDAKLNLTGGQRTQVDMKNGVLKREGDTRVAAVDAAPSGHVAWHLPERRGSRPKPGKARAPIGQRGT